MVCAQLLRTDRPFAVLLPTELVKFVAVSHSKKRDPVLSAKLQGIHKMVAIEPGFTWITNGLPMGHDVVLKVEDRQEAVAPSLPFDRKDWIQAQKAEEKS